MDDTPKKTPLLFPLTGDEAGHFELQLVRNSLAALESELTLTEQDDDYVFQSHLRFLGALYYVLGGAGFEEGVATRISSSPANVHRWITGESAPAPTVRERALTAAHLLLTHIDQERRLGATLYDLTGRHP